MKKRILVFGKDGQVASALRKILPIETIFIGRDRINFENSDLIREILNNYKPEIIINTAAYTFVDKAETEKEICLKINAEAPNKIALWCNQNKSLFIHFSTDYVYGEPNDPFNKNSYTPLVENTLLNPVNFYGTSKKISEEYIHNSDCNHIILRTSWIYYETGNNFVKTMLRLGSEKEELKIVNDQIGSPTYARDLANAVKELIIKSPSNIQQTYNICGTGYTSWFEFAKEIFSQANKMGWDLKIKNLQPIPTSEYKTIAQRPLNSKLNQEKIKNDFGIVLPLWSESLKDCLIEMRKI